MWDWSILEFLVSDNGIYVISSTSITLLLLSYRKYVMVILFASNVHFLYAAIG